MIGFDLSGQVVDLSGLPIEGAEVHLTVEMESLGSENRITETLSDAQGGFRITDSGFECAMLIIEVSAIGNQVEDVYAFVWQVLPPEPLEFVITLEPE